MILSEIFAELESLSQQGLYRKDSIQYWLLKHRIIYKTLNKDIDTLNKEFPNSYIRNYYAFKDESKFLDTYEVLLEVLKCYKKELYFKEQIVFYNDIKDNGAHFNSWLSKKKVSENKFISQFNQMFQNTTMPSGYEFIIRYPFFLPVNIKLDESDFKHTLQFLEILEMSRRLQFIGDISTINDLELFEKKTTKTNEGVSYRRAYKRQIITMISNDVQTTKLKVKFLDGKTVLLKDLKVGQRVKVYADIIEQNEIENDKCIKNLLGWHIEILK